MIHGFQEKKTCISNEKFGTNYNYVLQVDHEKFKLTLRQSHSLHPQAVNGQLFAHPVFGTFGTKK